MLPEILAYGEAGSGKDTFGSFLVDEFNAVTLAMADPMKRFAKAVFGFNDTQLWGPSSERNKNDPRFDLDADGKPVHPHEYEIVDAKLSKNIYDDYIFNWVGEVVDRDADPAAAYLNLTHKWWPAVKMQATALGRLNARTVLQMLGTEWGRAVSNKVWINNARRAQRQLLSGGYGYVRDQGLVSRPGQKYDWAVVTDGRFRNECLEFQAGGALVIKISNPEANALNALGARASHASEAEQRTIPDWWFSRVIINDKKDGLDAFRRTIMTMMVRWTDPAWKPDLHIYETANFRDQAFALGKHI
jgi:hypothetical protein